jgi:hypothetical protein
MDTGEKQAQRPRPIVLNLSLYDKMLHDFLQGRNFLRWPFELDQRPEATAEPAPQRPLKSLNQTPTAMLVLARDATVRLDQ